MTTKTTLLLITISANFISSLFAMNNDTVLKKGIADQDKLKACLLKELEEDKKRTKRINESVKKEEDKLFQELKETWISVKDDLLTKQDLESAMKKLKNRIDAQEH